MRIRHSTTSGQEKVELQMTPMIDVVFQLLIFFLFSFNIVALEGDFRIKMPQASAAPMPPELPQLPPIRVRLLAGPNGELAGIQMGEQPLASFRELHLALRGLVGDAGGPAAGADGLEVELDCDYELNYQHVIEAITAVTGYVADGRIVPLIDRVKFAPPRTSPAP
ncbi:MAG: biopolymer transporter ExbD [Pirellulales bacterium]|nr:biopolymer transporter ExbD [Pirellulales bacterium]